MTAEDRLQAECVRWFRYRFPKDVLFAIPNGGWRNKVTAGVLKATGTLAGVADLFLCHPGAKGDTLCLGLFIEMKVGKNTQTPSQREFQEKVENVGYCYALCRNIDEFILEVESYM